MEGIKTGVQLFTVRDYLDTKEHTEETLRKIAAMGYEGVELIGFDMLGWNFDFFPDVLKETGLRCIGVHEVFEELEAELEARIARAKKLGAEYMVCAVPLKTNFQRIDEVRSLCDRLNAAGAVCRKEGLKLIYHNHTMEFFSINGGNGLDVLESLTDPIYVGFEPCVYNIQLCGADPVSWCRRLAGRMPVLHLKDISVKNVKGELLPAPAPTELGHGNLNIREICAEAAASGAEWFVIEMHENCVDNDPFKSLQMCMDYFRNTLNLQQEV